MHEAYNDILSKIKTPPLWYDENGTPRYVKFHPKYCPDIYADTVVLLRIACQYCHCQFLVEMHSKFFTPIQQPTKLHYGDPPLHSCVGDSMNCEDLAVVEVWRRASLKPWKRYKKLEGTID